jgi:hypothetical protein
MFFEVVAIIIFIAWGVFAIVWGRQIAITYDLAEKGLKVRSFGVRVRNIPYEEIRYCEVVKADKLWRPPVLLGSYIWCHRRRFVDGIIIHSDWGNPIIIIPENPEEFVNLIAQKQQRQKATQQNNSK